MVVGGGGLQALPGWVDSLKTDLKRRRDPNAEGCAHLMPGTMVMVDNQRVYAPLSNPPPLRPREVGKRGPGPSDGSEPKNRFAKRYGELGGSYGAQCPLAGANPRIQILFGSDD